jgi:conserved oligomeric Golgi complex subunit 6
MLQVCSLSAINLSPVETSVYMMNCIYEIYSLLSLYEYTDAKIEKLEAQLDAHMDTLVNEQACFILTKTDLYDIYKSIQAHDIIAHGPLVNKLGLDSVTLKAAMTKFDAYLSLPDKLVITQSNMIMGTSLR